MKKSLTRKDCSINSIHRSSDYVSSNVRVYISIAAAFVENLELQIACNCTKRDEIVQTNLIVIVSLSRPSICGVYMGDCVTVWNALKYFFLSALYFPLIEWAHADTNTYTLSF